MSGDGNGRKKIIAVATLIAALISAGVAYSTYMSGVRAGENQAVAQAAVDQKRLADVEAKAQAASERIGERLVVDATQNTRIENLEQQHAELISRLNALIDIMWKDEIRRQGRQ